MKLEESEDSKELTPEEQLADKLRLQKLQEEADLELAKETFGEWEGWAGSCFPSFGTCIVPCERCQRLLATAV